jgi:hypothetical protein
MYLAALGFGAVASPKVSSRKAGTAHVAQSAMRWRSADKLKTKTKGQAGFDQAKQARHATKGITK